MAARPDDEIQALKALVQKDPTNVRALAALGGALQLEGRYDEAAAMADAALAANPACAAAWLVLGDSRFNAGRPDLAAEAYSRATTDPGAGVLALVRLGGSYRALGRFEEALRALDAAAALDPAAALARYQRGVLRLSLRDFAAGWADYEARWQTERFVEVSRGFVAPGMIPHLTLSPTAQSVAGQRVLLVGEQGIGDQIMFASMIPDLASSAASVVCACEPRLRGLFEAAFPQVAFVHPSGAQVEADVLLAMGSLGSAFRPNEASFPGGPYLKASEGARERWEARLGPQSGKLRVGLSWRGGTAATRNRARSIDLANLAPVLDLPGCELVSLQYGEVTQEIEAANAGRANPIRHFDDGTMRDFDELSGLIANLDVVVSVQTAVVHLAGALGRPCLALLPTDPEWRYLARGETMPWYGSVRLLRQTTAGDWTAVVEQAAAALARRAARPAAG